ncbi:MAG: hypothetical protein EOO40_12025, partial [Deltaproteobacteria bacterium]
MTSTTAEPKNVTATAGTAAPTTTVLFSAGAAQNVSWVASPNSVVADGNSKSTLTLIVRDAQNNAVPGVGVTFSEASADSILSATSGTTDAAGSVSVTLAATVAESKTPKATLTTTGTQYSTTVVFVPGPVSGLVSTLVASPNTVTADGTSATSLVFDAQDAFGNVVPGATVSVTVTGAGYTLGSASGTTDSGGAFTTTLVSTVAESKTVTLVANGVNFTVVVNFVPGSAAAAHSTLVASPNQLVADGSQASTLTLTVRDEQNNVVTNLSTTFASTGTAAMLTPTTGTAVPTDANGQAQSTLRSTYAESKIVTVSFGGATLQVPVTFVAGSPNSMYSSLLANPNVQT